MVASQLTQLQEIGWFLTQEGIDLCLKEHTKQDIEKTALNTDLNRIGRPCISEEFLTSKNVKSFQGPCILQVSKIRNIAAPSVKQKSNFSPRMLSVQLSDGKKSCIAIEHEYIKHINLDIAPGTKIKLRGTVKVQDGILLLTPQNVVVLGGKVESLYKKWVATKDLVSGYVRANNDTDNQPPPFIPFGKKIQLKYGKDVKKTATSYIEDKEEGDNESAEFKEQRVAVIESIQNKDVSVKTFNQSKTAAELTSQHNERYNNSTRGRGGMFRDQRGGGRGGRRGGRSDSTTEQRDEPDRRNSRRFNDRESNDRPFSSSSYQAWLRPLRLKERSY